MSILPKSYPEPVIKKVDVCTCPDCGMMFLDVSDYAGHLANCSIDSTLGKYVRWFENGLECVGRVVDTLPGEMDFDDYDHRAVIEDPRVIVVYTTLNPMAIGIEVSEEDVDPKKLDEVDRFYVECKLKDLVNAITSNLIAEILDGDAQ